MGRLLLNLTIAYPDLLHQVGENKLAMAFFKGEPSTRSLIPAYKIRATLDFVSNIII